MCIPGNAKGNVHDDLALVIKSSYFLMFARWTIDTSIACNPSDAPH